MTELFVTVGCQYMASVLELQCVNLVLCSV